MIKFLLAIVVTAVLMMVFLVSVIDGSTDKGDLVVIVIAAISVFAASLLTKKGG
jgi:hypothetical protein